MFKAFENGTESHAIHDLTVENDLDCVSVYGNLQITKDQAGLKAAKVLQALLNDIVQQLEETPDLPEKLNAMMQMKLKIHFYRNFLITIRLEKAPLMRSFLFYSNF